MREKGFTLVEFLVASAVSGVILASALAVISILATHVRGDGQVVALMDINRAALAVRNDLLMAQTTDLVNGVPKSSANLTWNDYTSSFGTTFQTDHWASYGLQGKELRRTYDGVVSIVGRNITSISFTQSATQTGKAITVIISAGNTAPGAGTETLNFSVHLRSEEVN